MHAQDVTVKLMSKPEMRRYDALNRKWAMRRKLTTTQFDWLMNNRTRYETTRTARLTSPL
jgi:hypothetical protein